MARHRVSHGRLAACLLLGSVTAAASAGSGSQTWPFDITTTGEPVLWVSPTSIDPQAALYTADFLITLVEVDVTWLGIPFNDIDVTGQMPPDLLAGSAATQGPAPILLFDQPVEYPGAPDPVCLAAQLTISLDAQGFGHLDATGVVLGSCDIDIGFGVVTVELQSVRMAGSITADALSCPWDLDGSGAVGTADLLALLTAWGTPAIGPPDLDADGVVATGDLLALLSNWGPCP